MTQRAPRLRDLAPVGQLSGHRLAVGRLSVSTPAQELAAGCGLHFRDTAQRGGAANKSCSSSFSSSTAPFPFTRTRTTTRTRDSRDLRRFGQILIECNSALRRGTNANRGVNQSTLVLSENLSYTFIGRMYLLPIVTVRERCQELLAMISGPITEY